MKSSIFVEDSGTTRDDTNLTFREFYQGGFRIVTTLAEQLERFGPSEINILSKQFGLIRGEDIVKDQTGGKASSDSLEQDATSALLESAESADVVVILLSSSTFNDVVSENWDMITEKAKRDSIWCLSAARSSLENLDLDVLRDKSCDVITYERVGVARLDNKSREELLERVKEKQT